MVCIAVLRCRDTLEEEYTMQKTLLAASVALALSSTAYAAPTFTPGTYKAEAAGIHGPVAVEVTFSKDKIEKIAVVSQKETPGIGTLAVDALPAKMVEVQSPKVDAVAGATITSNAIRTAVEACVKQAGVDPATLVPLALKKAAREETLTTDVVIVGGGGAGMSATIRTRMNGLDAVLVEKMPFIGGAASISGGQVVAQGSKLQKAFGVKDDSVESMMKDFLANGNNLNDREKLRLYAENVGATIDWLHDDVGVKIVPNNLPFLAEYSHRRAVEFQGGAGKMAEHLRQVIGSNGAKVLYNTKVEELIVENGAVVGVKAVDANSGVTYTIRAKKTLLTTGGYGNNKSMLTPEMQKVLYYGPVSSTGDGLKMAQGLGAKTQLLQYGKRYPNGIEVAPGKAKSTIYANVGAFDQVVVEGVRFVSPAVSCRRIREELQNAVFAVDRIANGGLHAFFEVELVHPECDIIVLRHPVLDIRASEAHADALHDAATCHIEHIMGRSDEVQTLLAEEVDEGKGRLAHEALMPPVRQQSVAQVVGLATGKSDVADWAGCVLLPEDPIAF